MAETSPDGAEARKPQSPKSARREAARQKAQKIQQDEQRRVRRRRLLTQLGIVLGVVVVAVLVVGLVQVLSRPSGDAPKNMATGGITLTKGLKAVRADATSADASPSFGATGTKNSPKVQVYLDYMCPYCGQFERQNSDFLRAQVKAGKTQLEIHPVAFLDSMSTTSYSTRAANAAAAVATYAPNSFFQFNTLMFANQPEEQSAGLTDTKIGNIAAKAVRQSAGPTSAIAKIRSAIKNQKFKGWVSSQTSWAQKHKVPGTNKSKAPLQIGTPVVFVNGKYWTNNFTDANSFSTFFAKTVSGSEPDAAVSASPSAQS